MFTTTSFHFPCIVLGATTSCSFLVVGFHLHEVLERPVHFSFFILLSVGSSVGSASFSFVGWAWMSVGSGGGELLCLSCLLGLVLGWLSLCLFVG